MRAPVDIPKGARNKRYIQRTSKDLRESASLNLALVMLEIFHLAQSLLRCRPSFVSAAEIFSFL
jgi:hypothetical protein